MRSPCCLCVCISPLLLLDNTFLRQLIYTQQYKNCWTRCFICGPCLKYSVCSKSRPLVVAELLVAYRLRTIRPSLQYFQIVKFVALSKKKVKLSLCLTN
jgi:hypothetical protein